MKMGLIQTLSIEGTAPGVVCRWSTALAHRKVIEHSGVLIPGVQGHYKKYNARDGLSVSVCDFVPATAISGSIRGYPSLSVAVMLQGGGGSQLGSGSTGASMPYEDGNVYVFLSSRRSDGCFWFPENQRIHMVELRIDWQLAHDMIDLRVLTASMPNELAMYAENDDGVWMGRMPAPRDALVAAEQITRCSIAQDAGSLFIEGKALELFACILDRLATSAARPAEPRLRSTDRKRVQAARDVMVGDIARNWTIAELARAAGVNEKKLKIGFKELYGVSVHRYLQDYRMKIAGRVLKDGDTNVTEISMTVGYANPSHFAKLFRRYYGTTPRAYAAAGDGMGSA